MEKELEFSDEVWSKVVQLIQLAMLTGIDVMDYLRQVRVVENDGKLVLSSGYKKLFDRTLEDLTERMVEIQASAAGAPPPREEEGMTQITFGIIKDDEEN